MEINLFKLLLKRHVYGPAYPIFGLFGFFFQPVQYFCLTTIQPEQYFSAKFQISRNSPISSGDVSKHFNHYELTRASMNPISKQFPSSLN